MSVSWCWNSADGVAFVSERGPLHVWVYGGPDPGVTMHKEAHSFLSDICLFRWHPTKRGKLVFGHTDGSLSVFQPGTIDPLTLSRLWGGFHIEDLLLRHVSVMTSGFCFLSCRE